MPIYQYTFPIPKKHYPQGFANYQLFVTAKKSPTKEQLRDTLLELVAQENRDTKAGYPEVGDILPLSECLACTMKLEGRFPVLEGKVVETYTMVRTKWGLLPLTVKLVEPMELVL